MDKECGLLEVLEGLEGSEHAPEEIGMTGVEPYTLDSVSFVAK